MKLSQVRKIYTETTIDTLPKEVRKEVFGILNLGNIKNIDENLIKTINEKINILIEEIELSKDEIEKYFKDNHKGFTGAFYQPEGENLEYSIQVFKSFFGRGVLKEDLDEISHNNIIYINDTISSDKNIDYRKIILGEYNLKRRLCFFENMCSYLGIGYDINKVLRGNFFFGIINKFFSFDNSKVGDFLKELKNIEGFNFEGIFDIDIFSLRRGGKFNYILDFINYFKIKDIKELGEEAILGVMIDGGFTTIKHIQKLEEILGIKLTLKDVKKGAIKVLGTIMATYKNSIYKAETMPYVFKYFQISNESVWSENKENFLNVFAFLDGLNDRHIPGENLFKRIMEEISTKLGFTISFDSMTEENFSFFLVNYTKELMIKFADEEYSDDYDESDEKYKYSKFFTKFSKFSKKDESGELIEDGWEPSKRFGEESEVFYDIINIDFINLFLDELDTIEDLKNMKIFNKFTNLFQGVKQNIINFISILSQNNIIEVKLEIIDENFIDFVDETFGGSEITKNINYPRGFFYGICSYEDFKNYGIGKPSLESEVLLEKSYVYDNLKYIFELYKMPVSISSFRRIEQEYIEKYSGESIIVKIPILSKRLKEEINFIYDKYSKGFGKEIELNKLLYILFSSKDEINKIKYELKLDNIDFGYVCYEEQLIQFLQQQFYPGNPTKFYKEFFKQENGELILNRDKRTLLKMIFDKGINLDLFKGFIGQFNGVTFGKLIRFYRDSGLTIKYYSNEIDIALIKYALDNNNYYYLKHNIDIIDKEKYYDDKIRDLKKDISSNLSRIRFILDKTGGFLIEAFIDKYVLGFCSEEELDKLIKSYNDTSIQLLGSGKLEEGNVDEAYAEAIFMAYRPTDHTIEKIKNLLNWYLQDNTEHLQKVSYNPNGYKKTFSRSSKELLSGKELDIPKIQGIETILKVGENTNFGFEGFNFKIFFTNSTDLKDLFSISRSIYGVNYDSRIEAYRSIMGENSNYDYTRLQSLNSIFGVVTKDSFETEDRPIISSMVSSLTFEELKNIFGSLKKIKDNKFKQLFKKYFKEEYIGNEEELRQCFVSIFYEQLNIIASRIRKEIAKELKKFGNSKGDKEEIRFNLCKNKASFFAMAGSELCTSGDIERHNEDRYLPVNIVDEQRKQIIGMLMLYVEEDKDYLVVRGFNLRKKMYSIYNIESIAETMVDFVRDFAHENCKQVCIPKEGNQHLISNFGLLTKEIKKISFQNKDKSNYIKEEKFEGGRIGQGGGFSVDRLYLLLDL